jgi:hypothetical protein
MPQFLYVIWYDDQICAWIKACSWSVLVLKMKILWRCSAFVLPWFPTVRYLDWLTDWLIWVLSLFSGSSFLLPYRLSNSRGANKQGSWDSACASEVSPAFSRYADFVSCIHFFFYFFETFFVSVFGFQPIHIEEGRKTLIEFIGNTIYDLDQQTPSAVFNNTTTLIRCITRPRCGWVSKSSPTTSTHVNLNSRSYRRNKSFHPTSRFSLLTRQPAQPYLINEPSLAL